MGAYEKEKMEPETSYSKAWVLAGLDQYLKTCSDPDVPYFPEGDGHLSLRDLRDHIERELSLDVSSSKYGGEYWICGKGLQTRRLIAL